MKLTTNEYIELINNHRWAELADTEFFTEYCRSPEIFPVSREFFHDFFLNTLLFITSLKNSKCDKTPLVGYICKSAIDNGFADVEFWKQYIDQFIQNTVIKTLTHAHNLFIFTGKNIDYTRALIAKKDVFDSVRIISMYSAEPNIFPRDIFPALSNPEKDNLRYVLDTSKRISLEDPTQLLEIFGTPMAVIDYSQGRQKIHSGEALKNLSQEEIEGLVEELVKRNTPRKMIGLMLWYRNNPGVEVFPSVVKTYLNVFPDFGINTRNFLGNMSKDDIIKNRENIKVQELIRCGKFTLREISQISGEIKDISWMGFFREEDILENPTLFNPYNLKKTGASYITPENFKILKKSWKTNPRYDALLMDFETISYNASNMEIFSEGDLFYLIEKCKPTNSSIMRGISRFSANADETPMVKKMKTLSKIMVKYR